ncbi:MULTISPECIES: bifunctional 2-keto-4-hydroxyglutarate aldolase/2-keto-3-deoxy-6-phosphogluconate aldolase [Lactobacillus]|uniref:bifunctional 2-keto-4-hydroxyglutarate aldolase/2-keto-3-deoxy-6-phosphogluconate aldolase n=1 Tax=Lactobacillus TaxID=1578 RepID=UPI0018DCB9D4|nr:MULTISPECIES: bifunctional 2-keto-4-hydroxyglutarate aldolase/2-keto-3-deoxy-6-phosphogluconate aldolase [unclassified Lactobacillus]MBI0122003.1 bifunctional 2-keto-4-hydroxyglutarate aldolase/2-keto-3-deoxy-6-phosphogluconate aldolase [Lactobacillus sp. M0398]MBI0123879.1 bifunctional 2-keto-4-hydroxyglutarate aldolase/2-keto-3-deoxy-6-phosphogluconate aldolase [Lactobacillus sp. W8174]MBI0136047.1 bifunctional 2-keto-4-hydroxyglutarate aldolase/2-keto-3-deoxy-6-phosphogluconate aldolase [L
MDKKIDILKLINQNFLVAVVRGASAEEAYNDAIACIAGGIKTIELTYTVPSADSVIKKLKEKYQSHNDIIIGAGTILDEVSTRLAILAGADFIVGPNFNKKIALISNLYQRPYIPGCMTTTEITTALSYGSDIVKVFPGNVLGTEFVKSILGPIPNANLMPTGGVDMNNISDWVEAGVAAVGIGSNLVGPGKDGNFDLVKENAQKYVSKLKSNNPVKL